MYADDQHLPALRRSMYSTATGLLLFSQGDLQESVEEPEEMSKRPMFERVLSGWHALNNKLKGIF